MFQFPGFASTPYVFRCRYRQSGGFPHSDIPGSKPVCRLPEAFRRLPRPSSPVVAKASTVCAYSLDHITPNTLRPSIKCANATRSDCFQRSTRLRSAPTLRFPIVKEHRTKNYSSTQPHRARLPSTVISRKPTSEPAGGARRDRTADPLLAKQVLSRLSYGPWWVWVELNHRPHPYQGCALTS